MALPLSPWTLGGLVIGLLALFPTLTSFLSGNKFDVKGKTVLLTGASEGMGKSVAMQLARKGASVIIVARNVGKLEEALRQVKASACTPSTQRFHFISADVTSPGETIKIIAEATAWNSGHAPDIVWCIAGSAYPSLFIDTAPVIMRQQMDINYWSCVYMAQQILAHWLSPTSTQNGKTKGSPRHLIFTSSVVAFYPIAGYSPYAPAKAAIKSLSDTLAQEVLLYGQDVKIHTVFPGTISSPGLERENETKPEITYILEESDPVQMPDVVAAKAIAGLERGEYLVTVSWLGAAMRGCAWGGSARNNWVVDTLVTWVTSIAWGFIGRDLDGKVVSYAKKHGHPSTYGKKT